MDITINETEGPVVDVGDTSSEIDAMRAEFQDLATAYAASQAALEVAEAEQLRVTQDAERQSVLSKIRVRAAILGAVDPDDIEKFLNPIDGDSDAKARESALNAQLDALVDSKPYLFSRRRPVHDTDILSGVPPRQGDVPEADVRLVAADDYAVRKMRFLSS